MSTPWILHRLYSLDASSLDFSRHLYCLIRHDEEDRYLTSLQGPQLARLVDFLDEVRALSPFYLLSSYKTNSADHQRHFRRRQPFSTVSAQITNHMCPPRDPTILIHHIW
jgi:hypothetical protein